MLLKKKKKGDGLNYFQSKKTHTIYFNRRLRVAPPILIYIEGRCETDVERCVSVCAYGCARVEHTRGLEGGDGCVRACVYISALCINW